jgi:hypothetical protein
MVMNDAVAARISYKERLTSSFKNADGGFEDPVATIPDVEDEGEESL